MINSVYRPTSLQGVSPVTPVRRRGGAANNLFRVSTSTGSSSTETASASSKTVSSASQILGTTASTSQSSATAASSTAASTTQQTSLTGDAAALQNLKDALTAAGINWDSLGLATHQDLVTSPGGSYVNRYISVETNGHEEGLMTDIVATNPNVAVFDIKRMLGQG